MLAPTSPRTSTSDTSLTPQVYETSDMMKMKTKTKTKKTPLMMAVAFGPTSCSAGLVPKSKHLHSPEAHDGFVPKLSRHGGKNLALRAEKPISARLQFSERRVELAPTIPNVSRLDRRSTFFSGAKRNGVFAFIDFKAWNAAYGLVMTDGSLLTIRKHRQQTQILEKIEINERVFLVFVK